jgi:hypothetical protein
VADTPTRRLNPICRTASININIEDVVHIENLVNICLLQLKTYVIVCVTLTMRVSVTCINVGMQNVWFLQVVVLAHCTVPV